MKIERDLNKLRIILEYLSVEELEELLQQDFEASDWVPDTEYIKVITEELEKREPPQKESVQSTELITDAAEKEDDRSIDPTAQKLNEIRLKKKTAKIAIIAFVISCLLITIWGMSMLHQKQSSDLCSELRTEVKEITDIEVVPQWIPEQYEKADAISVADRSDGTRLAVAFSDKTDNRFTIRIMVYSGSPDYKSTYHKDDSPVIVYEVAGINHYIMSNNKTNTAAWINEETENMITGDLTVDELKRMIDSIYEE